MFLFANGISGSEGFSNLSAVKPDAAYFTAVVTGADIRKNERVMTRRYR